MNSPTPEYLSETVAAYAIDAGYQKLRREGYSITRRAFQKAREQLIAEGLEPKQRSVWNAKTTAIARALIAEGKTSRQIAKETGTSTKQVYDLCHRLGMSLTLGRCPKTRSLPDRDRLAALYAENSIARVAALMNVSPKVASRWIKAYGLVRNEKTKAQRQVARVPFERRKRGLGFAAAPSPVPNETGPVAEAARYLRQQGYANVYRRGRDEWQVGSRVCSEADMLARVDEMKARRERMRA